MVINVGDKKKGKKAKGGKKPKKEAKG